MVLVWRTATRKHIKDNFIPGQSYGYNLSTVNGVLYSGVVYKSLEKLGLQDPLCSQSVKDTRLFPLPRYENWLFSLYLHLVVPSKIPKHWPKALPLYKPEINLETLHQVKR